MARLTEQGRANAAKREYLNAIRKPMPSLADRFLKAHRLGKFKAKSSRTAKDIVRAALDEAPKMSMARHDEVFHGGRFDPETMTCGLREQLADEDALDPDGIGSTASNGNGKRRGFATPREVAEYLEAYRAVEAARRAGSPTRASALYDEASRIFERVRNRAFAESKIVNSDGSPVTVYHGTEQGGFTEFDCDGKDKTQDTGAWFSSSRYNARTYSGSKSSYSTTVVDADYLLSNDMATTGLAIEREGGSFVTEVYPSKEELLKDYDLDPGERIVEGVISLQDSDGYDHGIFRSMDEAVRYALDNRPDFLVDKDEPCIYECHLMMRDPASIDAHGQNWDDISTSFVVSGSGGDDEIEDMFFETEEEANEFLEDHRDEGYEEVVRSCGESSDALAREARKYTDADGYVIENVTDVGGMGNGYGEESNDYVAFTPSSIKLADMFTFEDDGSLVPLDRRFDFNDPDIRH